MFTSDVLLHTCSGAHPLRINVAASFITRFAGLMLRKPLPPDQGLLLTDCPSVHTAFMRCAIDVVYLDQTGKVRKCVPGLKPWRGSFSHTGRDEHGTRNRRAAHALELAAGSIVRLAIYSGDRLQHPLFGGRDAGGTPHIAEVTATSGVLRPSTSRSADLSSLRQHGSAMIEFTVVGPIITLLGLAVLQYGMLFFAKNQINHATFMAARAGSMGNASLASVRQAYERSLIPLYGGGRNQGELNEALHKAQADINKNVRIELLNPTRESFDDWNDGALQRTVGKGKGVNGGDARVISNANLAFRNPAAIGEKSGQNIQDANLIKLRITHGVEPTVPLMQLIYRKYLQWLDTGGDDFHTQLVNDGRIPVVTHVTLHMQSDAIEPLDAVSSPGKGNGGNPTDPGDPPVISDAPPNCLTVGCTVISIPDPTPPIPPPNNCSGGICPVCP